MKNSTKITIAIIALFIITCAVGMAIMSNKEVNPDSSGKIVPGTKDSEAIKVAICSTYQYLFDEISAYGYVVVKTNSTAESIDRLRKREVDVVISGRKPLPSELDLQYKMLVLPNRYSFLSTESIPVTSEDLGLSKVYTDQNIEEIKTQFTLNEIKSVNNVYEYLNEGIVITSWENTDYSKASVVHVLQRDGTRHPNSRTPVVYSTNQNKTEYIFALLEKLVKLDKLK